MMDPMDTMDGVEPGVGLAGEAGKAALGAGIHEEVLLERTGEKFPKKEAAEHPRYREALAAARRGKWDSGAIRLWIDVEAVVSHGCYFDREAGDYVASLYPVYFTLYEGRGAGEPFYLMPWMKEDFVAPLFGWMRPPTKTTPYPTRRYRRFLLEVAKKNAKTTLFAATCIILLVFDGEPGAQVLCGAVDLTQSRMMFDSAMKLMNPDLKRRMRIIDHEKRVEFEKGFFRALSSKTDSIDGANMHAGILDEYHRHPDRRLFDILKEGGTSRVQPLFGGITTAGEFNTDSIGWQEHVYALQVRAGIVNDFEYLPLIYAADEEELDAAILGLDEDAAPLLKCAWDANPGMGITFMEENIVQSVKEARARGSADLQRVKRLRFNIWVKGLDRLFDQDMWEWATGPVDWKEFDELLAGRECYGGLDLSQTQDMTAWVLCFPPMEAGEPWRWRGRYWCPKERARERTKKHRWPYRDFTKAGILTETEGDVIDYGWVKKQVVEDLERFTVRQAAFDPMFATELMISLTEEGLEMVECVQNYRTFNPAIEHMLTLLRDRKFHHGGDPVLRWQVGMLTAKRSVDGYMRPNRENQDQKIDGFVAGLMAHGRGILTAPEDYPTVADFSF